MARTRGTILFAHIYGTTAKAQTPCGTRQAFYCGDLRFNQPRISNPTRTRPPRTCCPGHRIKSSHLLWEHRS
jgi:hypothetical protein